jgi:hypothetical protein
LPRKWTRKIALRSASSGSDQVQKNLETALDPIRKQLDEQMEAVIKPTKEQLKKQMEDTIATSLH